MTNSFDERQKAFENKAKIDEEIRFKLNAKAVKLFGFWAAAQLGLTGAAADTYAEAVMDADFDEPGIQDVLRKVQKDFIAKGIEASEQQLEKQFNLSMEEAGKR